MARTYSIGTGSVVAVVGIDYPEPKVLEEMFFAGLLAVLCRRALRCAGSWGAFALGR